MIVGRTSLATILLLAATQPAAAQRIRWVRDVTAGVQAAQREGRPILFYVLNRQRGGGRETRRDHAAVFRNPRVVAAAEPFVTIELAIDRHPELRERWNVREGAEYFVAFTMPDGELLQKAGVGSPDAFARTLRRALDEFAQRLWETRLHRTLTAADSSIAEKVAALRRVGELTIREAEGPVAALIEDSHTPPAVREAAFETLAALSTYNAIDVLLEHAVHDEHAAAALPLCTPVGAERMLDRLPPGDERLHRLVYRAAVAICDIDDARPGRFWERADERARLAEMRRVRSIVRAAAIRYQEEQARE